MRADTVPESGALTAAAVAPPAAIQPGPAAAPGRPPAIPVSPGWLRLREPADAAARAAELAERLAVYFAGAGPLVVHDLGGGSGSMGRWLAPRLPGRQHWVVHDWDVNLLKLAAADTPRPAADGQAVTVEPIRSDITRLTSHDLAGADLVTVSALLDLLTTGELVHILRACAGRPMLVTLTVVGSVTLTPPDPLDALIAAAFDAHQRRGGLLGPDAVATTVEELGAKALVRPSPWRLDAAHAALVAEWLHGWVAAARRQEPALAAEAAPYLDRRLAQAAAGGLAVTVEHADLLVLP